MKINITPKQILLALFIFSFCVGYLTNGGISGGFVFFFLSVALIPCILLSSIPFAGIFLFYIAGHYVIIPLLNGFFPTPHPESLDFILWTFLGFSLLIEMFSTIYFIQTLPDMIRLLESLHFQKK